MAQRDRQNTLAVACPHCGEGIIMNKWKTKKRKFIMRLDPLNAKGPCPHCGKLVTIKVEVLKGRVKKQDTAPETKEKE